MEGEEKLSLRDWLAGQALPHALARARLEIDRYGDRAAEDHVPRAARDAYRIADAMLAARKSQRSTVGGGK